MSQSRSIFLTTLLLYCISISYAQQDINAEPYLYAVSGQFLMNEGYLIHMDYKREDIMRETFAEGEGTIWMKGLKYKIEVDEYIVLFDGDKLYSQNTETKEVYISTPDPEQPSFLQAVPIRIFKSYKKDFNYRLMGRIPFNGRECIEVQLYPKDLSGPYSMLSLFINPGNQKLEGILLKHKEGIHYTMILKDVKGKQILDDSMFKFDPAKYPDTEIIELLD